MTVGFPTSELCWSVPMSMASHLEMSPFALKDIRELQWYTQDTGLQPTGPTSNPSSPWMPIEVSASVARMDSEVLLEFSEEPKMDPGSPTRTGFQKLNPIPNEKKHLMNTSYFFSAPHVVLLSLYTFSFVHHLARRIGYPE